MVQSDNRCVLQAEGLAQFLLRMLRFHPETRATAEELLNDPWLQGNLPEPSTEVTDIAASKRRRPAVPAEDKRVETAETTTTVTAADTTRATAPEAARSTAQQPNTAHGPGTTAPVRTLMFFSRTNCITTASFSVCSLLAITTVRCDEVPNSLGFRLKP